ncbi:DUF3606 domain-containing protein [Bradyrhizobium sp. Cham227]|nr:DUF3606 domain-containing protein [Bradyrhizobium brasilense]
MFDQRAKCPALEAAIGRAAGLRRQATLCSALHDGVSNQSTPPVIASASTEPWPRQHLCPLCRLGTVAGESNGKESEEADGARRRQDRARVAGGQHFAVRYEAKKSTKSAASVKKAVKKVGDSRKRVERWLG